MDDTNKGEIFMDIELHFYLHRRWKERERARVCNLLSNQAGRTIFSTLAYGGKGIDSKIIFDLNIVSEQEKHP